MIANKLPAVLYQPNSNSLSVERVLKQAIKLLADGAKFPDELDICLDDLQTLLDNLDRD